MGELDLEALKRLGLSDSEDLEEELAEIALQLPAIIAALERIPELERRIAKLNEFRAGEAIEMGLLRQQAERVKATLAKIASCEPNAPGDVVHIARAALNYEGLITGHWPMSPRGRTVDRSGSRNE